MIKTLGSVKFPSSTELNINMMPFISGDLASLPEYLHSYKDILEACPLKKGSTVYLTVHEAILGEGEYLRRPGIHTDGTSNLNWGGGWGSKEGIYIASNDGNSRIWDYETYDVDHMGALKELPKDVGLVCNPNQLYWITDRTPHESLPAKQKGIRQFFRLVSSEVSVWYSKHSTPNPLGVQPACTILHTNKFEV